MNSIAEMIKLSSVWCLSGVCLCVRNSDLEILPSGTFFPTEKNPAEQHHTFQEKKNPPNDITQPPKMANFAAVAASPGGATTKAEPAARR